MYIIDIAVAGSIVKLLCRSRHWQFCKRDICFTPIAAPAADLSSSKITNTMVSNMICGWKNCHTITLANNSIGDEAARQLCQAFYSMSQPALSQLSLAYNFLTDASAGDLATLITSCASLDALDVEGNMLSVKGIKGLACATAQSRISSLHLSHNTGDPARLAGSIWETAFISGRLKTLEIAQHFPEQAQVRTCQQ